MENVSKQNESGGVMNGFRFCEGFGADFVATALSGKPVKNMTVDEARKILNRALGDKSLYDYVREERDER